VARPRERDDTEARRLVGVDHREPERPLRKKLLEIERSLVPGSSRGRERRDHD
jgi:hypothetical protein